MAILEALVGGSLLLLGRKLFWLFVAGIGFVAGLSLAGSFLKGSPEWLILLVALGAGLVGALLAIFLESVAIGVVGFISGGYILNSLFKLLGIPSAAPNWIIVLIGGIIGVILIFALLDWMLIILSSLVGASMIIEAFSLKSATGLVVYVILVIVGIVIQSRTTRRDEPRRNRSRRRPAGQ